MALNDAYKEEQFNVMSQFADLSELESSDDEAVTNTNGATTKSYGDKLAITTNGHDSSQAVCTEVVHPHIPVNNHSEFDLNEFQDLSILESSDDEQDPDNEPNDDHGVDPMNEVNGTTTNDALNSMKGSNPFHGTKMSTNLSNQSHTSATSTGSVPSKPPPPIPQSTARNGSPSKFIHSKAALRNMQSKAGQKRKNIRNRVIGAISN